MNKIKRFLKQTDLILIQIESDEWLSTGILFVGIFLASFNLVNRTWISEWVPPSLITFYLICFGRAYYRRGWKQILFWLMLLNNTSYYFYIILYTPKELFALLSTLTIVTLIPFIYGRHSKSERDKVVEQLKQELSQNNK